MTHIVALLTACCGAFAATSAEHRVAVWHILCTARAEYGGVLPYQGRNGVGGLFSQLNHIAQEVLERLYVGQRPSSEFHANTQLNGYGSGTLSHHFHAIPCHPSADEAAAAGRMTMDAAMEALARAPRHLVVSTLLHMLYRPRASDSEAGASAESVDLAVHVRRGDRLTASARPIDRVKMLDEAAIVRLARTRLGQGGRTVLVASDDDAFTRAVCTRLEAAGFVALRHGNDQERLDGRNQSMEAALVCGESCVPPLLSLVRRFARARALAFNSRSNVGTFLLSWWFAANGDTTPPFVDLDGDLEDDLERESRYFCDLSWGTRRGLCWGNQKSCDLPEQRRLFFCSENALENRKRRKFWGPQFSLTVTLWRGEAHRPVSNASGDFNMSQAPRAQPGIWRREMATLVTPALIDWSSLQPVTLLAQSIATHQKRCTDNISVHTMNSFGLGSDLHTWAQSLCAAMEQQQALTSQGYWIWTDKELCSDGQHRPPLRCYFDRLPALPRPGCNLKDRSHPTLKSKAESGQGQRWACDSLVDPRLGSSRRAFQAASAEYLMAHLSPWLINRAAEASAATFGPAGPPSELITCHIRWGDKDTEMDLVPIASYVRAIGRLVRRHNVTQPLTIFLTTEDPHALDEFKAAAMPSWRVLYYAPAISKKRGRHGPANDAMSTKGSMGTHSMIALLLALRAKHYVLSTASTWSRLIDNVRRSVLDSSCKECTDAIDLRPCDDGPNLTSTSC